jgi:hypothetical protein
MVINGGVAVFMLAELFETGKRKNESQYGSNCFWNFFYFVIRE